MSWFDPGSSGLGSDRSVNCCATTLLFFAIICPSDKSCQLGILWYRICIHLHHIELAQRVDNADVSGTKLPSLTCGQSYNGFTIVNYDSRGVPDKKIVHITTPDS